MTHSYDFESFEFSPLILPKEITPRTEQSIIRALSIYAQIQPEEYDTETLDGLNDIADAFVDQKGFKVTEKDYAPILGVANYQPPRPGNDYAFIEGIAVHRSARGLGIGIYMINQLVELARLDGMKAIEGNSRGGVEAYYEKLGFDYVEDTDDGVRMRLELD